MNLSDICTRAVVTCDRKMGAQALQNSLVNFL